MEREMKTTNESAQALMRWVEMFMRQTMQGFLQFAKQNGLSMGQMTALFHISRGDASSVSGLGGEMEMTNPAASQLLERLVQQGLIVREEDARDRRYKQISLSEKGDELLKRGLQAREKWLEEMVSLMSPEEQDKVTEALELMLRKAAELERGRGDDVRVKEEDTV
jgi:DNA-binding MarR family transcriptional regulator